VNPLRDPNILARILLPIILVSVLGLAPRSRRASTALLQASTALNAGNPHASARWLAQAAAELPRQPGLWEMAGEQAYQASEYHQALVYFGQAQNLSIQGQLTYAEVYWQTGQTDAAVRLWERAANQNPNPEIYTRLAQAHRQLGDFPSAVSNLRLLISLDLTNAAAYYQLGLLLSVMDPSAAAANLSQAAEIDPQYSQPARSLQRALRSATLEEQPAYLFTRIGQALSSLDAWDLALAAFEQAVGYDPDYAEAWAYLGEARQRMGVEGFAALETALALNPVSLSANIFMSTYWRRQGDPPMAIDYMLTAAQLAPNNPALQADLGALYLAAGDLNAALTHYQRAVELAPNTATYGKLLVAFCVENRVFLEEIALPAALDAVRIAPADPEALLLLGRVYFLLDDLSAAASLMQQALQVAPDYAPTHLHLALYYLAVDDPSQAHQHLALVVDLDPQSELAQVARRLLAQYFP